MSSIVTSAGRRRRRRRHRPPRPRSAGSRCSGPPTAAPPAAPARSALPQRTHAPVRPVVEPGEGGLDRRELLAGSARAGPGRAAARTPGSPPPPASRRSSGPGATIASRELRAEPVAFGERGRRGGSRAGSDTAAIVQAGYTPTGAPTPRVVHMAIEIDPVCGMEVDTTTTDLKLEHDGTTYWFCGKGCLLEFRDDPERSSTRTTSRRCDAAAAVAACTGRAPDKPADKRRRRDWPRRRRTGHSSRGRTPGGRTGTGRECPRCSFASSPPPGSPCPSPSSTRSRLPPKPVSAGEGRRELRAPLSTGQFDPGGEPRGEIDRDDREDQDEDRRHVDQRQVVRPLVVREDPDRQRLDGAPAVKFVTMISSNDRANASSAPASSAVRIAGK